MADLRWSLTAGDDLRAIEEYIVPEFDREDLHEVLFGGLRIVYLPRGDTVTVLRSVHGARDLAGLAEREPWELD